jgi:hypothetical protein
MNAPTPAERNSRESGECNVNRHMFAAYGTETSVSGDLSAIQNGLFKGSKRRFFKFGFPSICRTFNPKVAGSRPARPIGELPAKEGYAHSLG